MAKASLNTPRIDVKMTAKPNGSASQAQYVAHDNPPQPTAGTIENIPAWQTKLPELAQEMTNEFIESGVEPGGLIYLIWGKDSSTRIKLLPPSMRVSSACAILRGLAAQLEASAVQSKRVGELIEESKLNG